MGDPLFFSKMNTKQEKLARPIFEFLKNEFDSHNSCSLESTKKFKQINASYYGHFKWANSYRLIQKYKMESWL